MADPIQLTVTHGSVAYARHPVVVGHYENDSITSAELYLNRCLGNRLKLRRDLGRYPGPLGTAEVFQNPDSAAQPKGAIVVGLGAAGALTLPKLALALERAVLAYLLSLIEAANGVGCRASLTTLLIGSGSGGLGVRECVRAILTGVLQGADRLSEKRLDGAACIERLEFIELWEDRAIEAARALSELAKDSDFAGRFDFADLSVRSSAGGRYRVAYSEDPDWSRRLRIVDDGQGRLQFNLLTDRARGEVRLHAAQRALVDRLIDSATRFTGSDAGIGRTLFELLAPNELKDAASGEQSLLLILNEEAARYPWELLESGRGARPRPIAVEVSVIRQLETSEFRRSPNMAAGKLALVIADPQSSMRELVEAQKEAEEVLGRLRMKGFDPEHRIRTGHLQIINALYANSYRILHLCGHGVSRQRLPDGAETPSGMVIGDGILLTAAEIEQMQVVPELVFVNCCYLGQMEANGNRDPGRLASNLAAQFIRVGVRAVVAAGWQVEDEPARLFARTFYDEMLAGATFSRAVLRARGATHRDFPQFNTWGAYQCYGDPDFSLFPGAADESKKPAAGRAVFFAPSEAITELRNLASDAKTASAAEIEVLRERLETLQQHLPDAWRNRASLRLALARAYGELGSFGEAVAHYQAALPSSDEDVPVRGFGEMANLQSRWAVQLWKQRRAANGNGPETGEPDCLAEIDRAIATLSSLLAFGIDSERLSLLGGCYKRKAWVSEGDARTAALVQMADHYQRAYECIRRQDPRRAVYPLLNWLSAAILLHRRGAGEAPDLSPLDDFEQSEVPAVDFWDTVIVVDSRLVRSMAKADLPKEAPSLGRDYQARRRRAGSPREFRSVVDNLEFLRDLSVEPETAAALSSILDALR